MAGRSAIKAGLLYGAAAFAAGFALGALRVLAVAPRLGALTAVALEAPVMLAICWAVCGWATRRLAVSDRVGDRLVMGGVAIAVLLIAETLLATLGFGRPPAAVLASYAEPAGRLGLIAQALFAIFPLVRRRL